MINTLISILSVALFVLLLKNCNNQSSFSNKNKMESIKITVGSPNYGKGQTSVVISHEGLIDASNICHKDTSSCNIELSEEDTKNILSTIQNRVGQLPSSKQRKGIPGEVEYDFEINFVDKKSLHFRVWDNDISKDKELKKAIRQLKDNILSHSEQKILL